MTHNKKSSILKRKKRFFSNKRGSKKHNTRSKKQSLWRMSGCGEKRMMRGGDSGCGCGATVPVPTLMGGAACSGGILGYPHNNISRVDNLAYTGKGGNTGKPISNGQTKRGDGDLDHNIYAAIIGGTTSNNNNMSLDGKYPSGTMGQPWGPSYSQWPGTNQIQGDRNFYMLNPYNQQPDYIPSIQERATPPMMRLINGGRKSRLSKQKSQSKKRNTFRKHMRKHYTKKNKRSQMGGLPALGIMTDIKNTFNTLRGNPQLPSPLPFNDQLKNTNLQLNM
jgi:hypothetical protein